MLDCRTGELIIILVELKHYSGVIRHLHEYPTMHYFGIPTHSKSMKAYMILTEYRISGKSSEKLQLWEHC